MEKEELLAATDAIRKALNKYALGCANPDARREIDTHLETLRHHVPMFAQEKVGELAGWIDDLFSARMHQHYGRGQEGIEAVKGYAVACIETLKMQIARHRQD